jgi:hypothetical protein
MTDLQRYKKYWKFEGQRATKTKQKYEQILFSIWKNHHNWDWEDGKGVQIKCDERTIYRVVEMAEKAGLLKKTKNYYVGQNDRFFEKNIILFDKIYRDKDNLYGLWLRDNKSEDIVREQFLNEMNSVVIKPNKKTLNSYSKKTLKSGKLPKRIRELKYDLNELYKLSETMLPHYYNLLLKMNEAAVHDDLKFYRGWLKFDSDGFPTGRPWSYFCSTLNPDKRHKRVDTSREFRPDFLKRIGIPKYYEVYDIKSEYPRINYLFHTGVWKPDDYDFYSEIVNDTEMLKYTGEMITRGATKNTDYEDSMKQLFMRIYFEKGTDTQSYVKGYILDVKKRKGNSKLIDNMIENDEWITLELWKTLAGSLRKIVGPSIGNLINWYSFFIETEVKIELLKKKMRVYNVYDGFYSDRDIRDDIIEILDKKSKYVYNKFMKPIIIN